MNEEIIILEQWFEYATDEHCDPVVGFNGDDSGFTINDVADVYGMYEGNEWSESRFIAIFKLKDGRFASLRAWWDYTFEGATSNVTDTFEHMWQFGLDDEEREGLKEAKEKYLILKLAGIEK